MQAVDHIGLRRIPAGNSRLQWAALGLNRELQIAVGSAGPHRGVRERSSRVEWAALDLDRGASERSGQRQTLAVCHNARRYVRNYVRKEGQKILQKECQKICQKKC